MVEVRGAGPIFGTGNVRKDVVPKGCSRAVVRRAQATRRADDQPRIARGKTDCADVGVSNHAARCS